MAKTSRKKTPLQRSFKQTLLDLNADAGKHPVIAITLGLIALALIAVAYHYLEIFQSKPIEKKQFAALESQMQTSMDEIVATVGRPYELHHGQGCGYSAQKYSRGQLNCNNYYLFDYQTDSIKQGNEKMLKVREVVEKYFRVIYSSGAEGYVFDSGHGFDGYGYKYNMGCDLNYDTESQRLFNDTSETFQFKAKVTSPFVAKFTFGCGNNVVAPVYDVEDKPY